jgi:hypothetical protein
MYVKNTFTNANIWKQNLKINSIFIKIVYLFLFLLK